MIRLLALRELRSLFAMPSTWFVLAALQFIFAWFFLNILQTWLELQPQMTQLAGTPGVTAVVAPPMFNMISLLMMMMAPMYTMRLIAEERRNQSFALLLAAPIAKHEIVLGKFVGLLAFMMILVASIMAMLGTLALGTKLDLGMLLANMLGVALLTASYIAAGMYISSLTAHSLIAAIGSLALLTGLWLADIASGGTSSHWQTLSPMHHFQSFNGGLLDSGDTAFFVLFIAFFLALTIRRVSNLNP